MELISKYEKLGETLIRLEEKDEEALINYKIANYKLEKDVKNWCREDKYN